MNTLLLTIIIAFIAVIVAIGLLGIGWLLTGKSKIQRGACGRDPTKKREEECGTSTSCNLCEHPKEKQ